MILHTCQSYSLIISPQKFSFHIYRKASGMNSILTILPSHLHGSISFVRVLANQKKPLCNVPIVALSLYDLSHNSKKKDFTANFISMSVSNHFRKKIFIIISVASKFSDPNHQTIHSQVTDAVRVRLFWWNYQIHSFI